MNPRLSTSDLLAAELADALYLASLMDPGTPERAIAREPEPSPPVPAAPQSPPAAAPTAVPTEPQPAPTPAVTAVAPRPLADFNDIARALRPFNRRRPSPWQVELDEVATAERAVEDGLWLPRFIPAPDRWFELALIVDDGPTMPVWRQTVASFVRLTRQQGAFRQVLVRSPHINPGELVDPAGRRAILILTDGGNEFWQTPAAAGLLTTLAAAGPTAVVHLLPQHQWHRTAIRPRHVQLFASRRGLANRDLRMRVSPDRVDPFAGPIGPHDIPVPVLELRARWLDWWARLVAVDGQRWLDAAVLLPGSPTAAAPTVTRPASSRDRVLRFRSSASPTAFRLATRLAAAPLELPLVHQLQRSLVPESHAAHLAELLASDLVEVVDSGGAPVLEFVAGARDALLAGATRADAAQVLQAVWRYYGDEVSSLRSLPAALGDPDAAADPAVTEADLPFVRAQAAVFRALSGPYAARAQRLDRSVAEFETARTTAVPPEPGTGPTARRPLVWGQVPPANPHFTGREELLAELHDRLALGPTALLPHPLYGLGGVGRTQLAIEYVYRHAADHDLVWWVPAERPGDVLAGMTELAARLGLSVTAVPDALRDGVPYANWLLVFADAEDLAAVQRFIPSGGAGRLLITSRDPRWSGQVRTMRVDVFRRDESVALLRRRAPEITEADGARLAAVLGDLPLAVELAASWLTVTGMTVDVYLQLLEAQRAELADATTPAGYPLPVVAAWHVSLDRLRSENVAALQLSQVCSFFASGPIGRDLLAGRPKAPIADALDVALGDPAKVSRAVRDLQRFGLARVDHRADTVWSHRLSQAVIVRRIPASHRPELRHGAHVLLAAANPHAPRDAGQWPRYQALRPHVTASRAVECDDPWVRELVIGMVEFLYHRGDHEGCLELAAEVSASWPASDPRTLSVTRWHGVVLRALGRYVEAAYINRRALDVYRESFGADDDGTLDAMTNVVGDLRCAGEFGAARELAQEVFDRTRRLFGPDDPRAMNAARDLARGLRLTGEFEPARRLDEETWPRFARSLGHDHADTLDTLTGLATDRREAGDYRGARELQEGTYRRHREVFGEQSLSAIRSAGALSVARRKAGDLAGAGALSRFAVRQLRQHPGSSFLDSAAAGLARSIDLRLGGDLAAARLAGEDALGQYERHLGPRHPHSLSARTGLAVTLRLMGDLVAAYRLDGEAVTALREVLGPDHPVTLAAATNLASDRYAGGDYQAAYEADTDTLERSRRVLGEDHPSTLARGANLALDLRALGRLPEAATISASTLIRLRRTMGETHPATLDAARGLRADCDVDPVPI